MFFLSIPSVFSFVFTEDRIEFGPTAKKARLVECCSDVCTSLDFCNLHIWSWSSTRLTIRFFLTTLTKALLHQLLSLARRPAHKESWLFQTSSIKFNRDYMLLWAFNGAAFFFQMCGLTQTCFWALKSVLGFCSDMHYQLLDLMLRNVCLSKSYPFSWICHRLASLKV